MKHDLILTIGHNVNDRSTWNTPQICDRVAMFLKVNAFTAFECVGMWCGMPETSTRIEICAIDNAKEIAARIPALASALDQACVMCSITESTTRFINAEQTEQQIAK